MKKFTIPCNFGGTKSPFTVYIGEPEPRHHPLHFQNDWLSKERGGSIPGEVMDAIAKLKELAEKNGVPFEDLCVYALQVASEEEGEINTKEAQSNFDALNTNESDQAS